MCKIDCPHRPLLDASAELAGINRPDPGVTCPEVANALGIMLTTARTIIKTDMSVPSAIVLRALATMAEKRRIINGWKKVKAANSPSQLLRPEDITNTAAINYAQNFLDALEVNMVDEIRCPG
jgi:hypothetical protein